MRTKFRYQVGEVVNETLEIIRQTRGELKKSKVEKEYEVKSTVYPNAPTYIIGEYSLMRGTGCAYRYGNRVFEGNSLYNEEWARPYLVDIEQAKKIPPYHNKKILAKCPNCGNTKLIKPGNLKHQGIKCHKCSTNISYPEKFMISYLEVKGIEYEYQKVFKDLPSRRFDFYIPKLNMIIETHGEQHYRMSSTTIWRGAYNSTKVSDEEKRRYTKLKGIELIEIDCRISEFEYIKDKVNKSNLPNILPNEYELMLKYIKDNSNYNIKYIIDSYVKGTSSKDIAKDIGVSASTIVNLLKKNNVPIRKGSEYCRANNMYSSNDKRMADYRELYDVDAIIDKYNKGMNRNELAKEHNVSRQTITRILQRYGISLDIRTKKKVKCITTGVTYNSISEAGKDVGVAMKSLSSCLRKGEKATCGEINGKRLKWTYI